jgi:hypothetical protein
MMKLQARIEETTMKSLKVAVAIAFIAGASVALAAERPRGVSCR